jgi:hypothetical protein
VNAIQCGQNRKGHGWAYDRKSHVGKLDKAWDEAVTKRWIVVSMKDDWKTIFPNAAK